jgi:hypothetical protein
MSLAVSVRGEACVRSGEGKGGKYMIGCGGGCHGDCGLRIPYNFTLTASPLSSRLAT